MRARADLVVPVHRAPLAPAPDEIVAKTVEAFKAIDPDYIIPMHCTGFNTIVAVHHAMPGKLVMPSTGTRVIFGA